LRRRRASLPRRMSKFGLRWRPVCWFAVIICILLGASVGCVWQKVKLITMGYELRRLSLQERTLVASNTRCKDVVAKLEAPVRIEAIARNQLGMVRPQSWQLVSIRMENPVPPPKPDDEEPLLPETRGSIKGFSFAAVFLD